MRSRPSGVGMATHAPVVVVGGGQAGLSVSYLLKEQGIEHVLFERSRIGSSWRDERWDSFCLVTPNWQCDLPGHPYRGPDPHGFMKKDEIVAYIDAYVAAFDPPVVDGTEVLSLRRATPPARFEVTTSRGRVTCNHVVVATGGYHKPRIPAMARELPERIVQVHSAQYRNPDELPPGEVLVVGTGQSGCQIAEDLHLAGRKVHLCVGNAPRCARRYRGRDVVDWLHDMGHYDLAIDKQPNPDQVREKTNHYVTGRDGGRDIDLRKFALEGMRLYGPLRDVRAGVLTFGPDLARHLDEADDVYRSINRSIDAYIAKEGLVAPEEPDYVAPWSPPAEPVIALDVAATGITSVVWSIGFTTDFGWIDFPVLDGRGQPTHHRGVTPVEGLYFIGLPWLHTWGSGRFASVGRDARYIVERIAGHAIAESGKEGDAARAQVC